jgi:ATP-dependent Clp protease adaptor protein ClpS
MENTHKLVLYNDDENSYLEIMACLVAVCDFEPLQAEQCALIANNNGKCDIKHGDFADLLHKKSIFDEMGVHTSIKEIEKV